MVALRALEAQAGAGALLLVEVQNREELEERGSSHGSCPFGVVRSEFDYNALLFGYQADDLFHRGGPIIPASLFAQPFVVQS